MLARLEWRFMRCVALITNPALVALQGLVVSIWISLLLLVLRFMTVKVICRDGNSGACPRAWPGNAHCGAGLGKDIMARLVAGLAGQDRDGTGPKRDGPKRDAGKH